MVPRHVQARRAQSPRPVRPGGGTAGVIGSAFLPVFPDRWAHGVMCACSGCRAKVLRTDDERDPSGGPRQ